MLATLVLLCLAISGVAAWIALRARRVPAVLPVALAGIAPLAAFAFMQSSAHPSRSAYVFEVLGQFHPLTREVVIGHDSLADLALPDLDEATTVRLRLSYAADAGQTVLRVERSAVPIFWGGRPINAVRVGRKAVVAAPGGGEVVVGKPWWCWFRCDDINVRAASSARYNLAAGAQRVALGDAAVVLFRSGWRDYIAADPRAGVTVDAAGIPDAVSGEADSLRIGTGARAPVIDVNTALGAHRFDLLFREGFGRLRWDLPTDLSDPARFLVSADTRASVPGTAPVLNPAAVAPGAARQPYGGMIELGADGWEWRTHGRVTAVRNAEPTMLPGIDAQRSGGHIVSITQRDTRPQNALLAAAIAWALGIGLLAWTWRWLQGAALAARIAVLGCIYTLIFVRGALAFRAWLAPPNHTSTAAVFIGLLIGLPALVAAYHSWEERSARPERPLRARTLEWLRSAIPVWLMPVAALAAVFTLVLPDWRGRILVTALAPLVAGIPGLLFLRELLVAPHVRARGPLGVLDEGAARDYAYRHLATAIVALVFLGGLLGLVSQVIDHGRLLAVCVIALIGLFAMAFTTGPRAFIRPPRRGREVLLGAIGGVVPAAAAYVVSRSWALALGTGALAAVGAALLAKRSATAPRIRPFGLRDALRPGFMLVVFAALIVLTALGLMRQVRVLAEYGLTIAGLIVLARIFAILWFRQADDALHRSITGSGARAHVPSMFGLGAVLVLALAVYIPLGAHDPGLALLFFSAAAITATVGLAATGMRTTMLGVGMLALLVATFFGSMYVRPATLQSARGVELSTPEIRYAAAMTPAALELHLTAAPVSQGTRIINTLQQDWGQRYYTALAGTAGRGYFGTDFLDRGVTTPVALAENVYAVFLMSEHGWLGAIAVLAAYAALVLTLFAAAMWACNDRHHVPRGVLLAGLATFWAVPTLYMIAANASLLPLTGQNVPLLGLLSPADVALSSLLSALALTALPIPQSVPVGEHATVGARLRPIRRVIGITATATFALFVVLAAALWRPTHEPPSDFRMAVFADHVERLVNTNALVPRGDTVVVSPAARQQEAFQRGNFLAHAVSVSNRMAGGERGIGSACFNRDALVRVSTDNAVQVARAFCGLSTATSGLYAWRGSLRSKAGQTEYVVTDGTSTVLLGANAPDRIADLGSGCEESPALVRARAARVGCTTLAATIRFGSTALTIEPTSALDLQIDSKAARDVGVLKAGERLGADQLDLLVTSVPAGALTYSRWENGSWRRIAGDGTAPWLIQLDSQVARALSTRDARNTGATVTIDRELHYELNDALGPACATLRAATACSVLVADPQSGALVAFSQWHARDAAPGKFRPVDANLRNHPAASTIKPIIAAAALDAYPALARLEVAHTDVAYLLAANTPLVDTLRAARRYPNALVPWNGFLGASDNLYAVSLGFLAAGTRGNGGLPRTTGTTNPSGLEVAGRALPGRPVFPGRMGLHQSPLAESMQQLFGVSITEAAPAYEERFWQTAAEDGILRKTGDLQRISPEPVALALNTIRDPREFASFLIGGGTNRWNNVALVQAFSRVYTGRPVELHLMSGAEPAPTREDARLAKATRPVVEGLRAVTQQPWGTAYTLRTEFDPQRVTWIAKTGTLAESHWTGSLLLFAGSGVGRDASVCPTAGIVTIELRRGADPDGKAVQVFREQIADLLRRHRGWGAVSCTR